MSRDCQKSDSIHKAVSQIKRKSPAYGKMLEFYEPVFQLQEKAQSRVNVKPFEIKTDLVEAKRKGGFPLMTIGDFQVDTRSGKSLFLDICELARNIHPDLGPAGEILKQAVTENKFSYEELVKGIIREDDGIFQTIYTNLDVDPKAPAMFTYLSMVPSIRAISRMMAKFLEDPLESDHGFCPVCGSPPALASLTENGERRLHCGFCRHLWKIGRMLCPFCKNKDAEKLFYFYSDPEPHYRVYGCDECKQYVKTVDLGKLKRFFHPPLEQVATLHLDVLAGDKGLGIGP